MRIFCEVPISLLGEIWDSVASAPPSDAGGTWTLTPSPTAIMETHSSCKLIRNHDFGKCSKETQKGLIKRHFPTCQSPDKWDWTLLMCSGLRQHGEVVVTSGIRGAAIGGVVVRTQPNKYLLRFRGKSHHSGTHKAEEKIGKNKTKQQQTLL